MKIVVKSGTRHYTGSIITEITLVNANVFSTDYCYTIFCEILYCNIFQNDILYTIFLFGFENDTFPAGSIHIWTASTVMIRIGIFDNFSGSFY